MTGFWVGRSECKILVIRWLGDCMVVLSVVCGRWLGWGVMDGVWGGEVGGFGVGEK